ncbi:trans-aconitate 2-methyltransferase [Mycobacterium sp. E2462]|uniref:class I SAM-dependent methyltransferase n=1 Tax=Mycobacterium sp. E2462 TaxID=1834133 RepID=UPI0009EEC95F|nr:methyltransferase domain-containing protein [Mycobacterium sp. E2462]
MSDPMHFNDRSDLYRKFRPPYPADLWQRVQDTGLVGHGRRALDLGAGTGEATGPLLAEGMEVVAVEPGRQLASALAAAHPDAQLLTSRAEDVDFGESVFDLVVAATSFHWMNLDVLAPKIDRWLKPGGRLLVWRSVFGDPSVAVSPFRAVIQKIVARRPTPERTGKPEDVDATAYKLRSTGFFVIDDICAYRWSTALNADQIHGLFSTFSDWSPEEVDEATAGARSLGGEVVEHYTSWLIIASPRASPRGSGATE